MPKSASASIKAVLYTETTTVFISSSSVTDRDVKLHGSSSDSLSDKYLELKVAG